MGAAAALPLTVLPAAAAAAPPLALGGPLVPPLALVALVALVAPAPTARRPRRPAAGARAAHPAEDGAEEPGAHRALHEGRERAALHERRAGAGRALGRAAPRPERPEAVVGRGGRGAVRRGRGRSAVGMLVVVRVVGRRGRRGAAAEHEGEERREGRRGAVRAQHLVEAVRLQGVDVRVHRLAREPRGLDARDEQRLEVLARRDGLRVGGRGVSGRGVGGRGVGGRGGRLVAARVRILRELGGVERLASGSDRELGSVERRRLDGGRLVGREGLGDDAADEVLVHRGGDGGWRGGGSVREGQAERGVGGERGDCLEEVVLGEDGDVVAILIAVGESNVGDRDVETVGDGGQERGDGVGREGAGKRESPQLFAARDLDGQCFAWHGAGGGCWCFVQSSQLS